MKPIGDLLQNRDPRPSPPSHEKAAAVNEIMEVTKGDAYKRSYGYWLDKVGTARYTDVLEIVKKAAYLPAKYSRGGFITNRLKEFALRNEPAEPTNPA